MKIEYVICPACHRTMGLTPATGTLMAVRLPDPFEIKCIHCGAISSLPKSEIETIDVGQGPEHD